MQRSNRKCTIFDSSLDLHIGRSCSFFTFIFCFSKCRLWVGLEVEGRSETCLHSASGRL